MGETPIYKLHDIVEVKKPHPCGGRTWRILRMGIDFRLECVTCGRQVMLPRSKFEKMVKRVFAK